jgi:predicted nuclease of predicted toxin-antitoxin system
VSRTGLPVPADDRQIWEWAKTNEYIVITNDENFYRFAGVLGFPPKVVMLRTGNQSTQSHAALLLQHFVDIQTLADSPESGVLELY